LWPWFVLAYDLLVIEEELGDKNPLTTIGEGKILKYTIF